MEKKHVFYSHAQKLKVYNANLTSFTIFLQINYKTHAYSTIMQIVTMQKDRIIRGP